MRVPAEGGEEQVILEDVGGWRWDVSNIGVVFLARNLGQGLYADLFRFSDNRVHRLGKIPFAPHSVHVSWAVSRDGKRLLTNQVEMVRSDLMLLENLR